MRPPAPWAILDVDVGAPLGTLARPTEANAVVLRFRLEGAVLGLSRQPACAFPMGAGEVARLAALTTGDTVALLLATGAEPAGPARLAEAWERCGPPDADPLARLREALAARRARPPGATGTVVVCTRHRPDDLVGCLVSLGAEIAAGREVIVADNGPDPATEAAARDAGARYLAEPRPGLSRARNRGVLAATGEVVIFVDDDVRPEPGWASALLRAFDAPDIDVVCGLALPDALETEAQIAFEHDLGFGGMGLVPRLFDGEFRSASRGAVPVWDIGAGANMAVRRSRVIELGGFDERIGPGAAGGCGDDSEYWHRVLFAGGRLVYDPLSVVRHRHRRDGDALRRQAYGYGFGHVVALFAQYGRDRDAGDLGRAFGIMPRWLAGRALRAPLRRAVGQPDELLGPWVRGYLAALPHARLAFRPPPRALPAPSDTPETEGARA